MRVLIPYGTKRGGTEGTARHVADALEHAGPDVTGVPARQAHDLERYQAVIVGGARCANRWHKDASGFVSRNVSALRGVAPIASAITHAPVFGVSCATGAIVSTMPWPKLPPKAKGGPDAGAAARA